MLPLARPTAARVPPPSPGSGGAPQCQQTSTALYRHPTQRYDRGHLIPANHLDYSATALQQSQYMTNILPQAATMTRGAWYRTEKIIECYRDINELLVLGGVMWGQNADDDYFLASHGVATPDAFWKLILRGTGRVIAWIIPNSPEATQASLDAYLVSVRCQTMRKRRSRRCPGWCLEDVTGDKRPRGRERPKPMTGCCPTPCEVV